MQPGGVGTREELSIYTRAKMMPITITLSLTLTLTQASSRAIRQGGLEEDEAAPCWLHLHAKCSQVQSSEVK